MIQQNLMNNAPTKFHEGDRVKLLLWEDIDFYGIVKNVEWSNKGVNNLVEDDDGFLSWFEDRWLKKEDKPKPINFGGCVFYPDTKHIVNMFKDKFTIQDLPQLEAEAEDLKMKGYTGHHYSVVLSCIEALSKCYEGDGT